MANSFNTMMAGASAATIGRQVQSNVQNTMQSFNIEGPSVGPQGPSSSINWLDYNYPPCLKLIHYDPNE